MEAIEANAEAVRGSKGLTHEGHSELCLQAWTSSWGQWSAADGF